MKLPANAVRGKHDVGLAIKKISDETCEGKRLFIRSEYRGKGYASGVKIYDTQRKSNEDIL